MATTQRDLQLLVETLQNKQEAEADGVKFIYMDDSTIYRFENNRMKKVSAALLKKANKFIQNEALDPEANENITTAKQARQLKTSNKQRKQRKQAMLEEDGVKGLTLQYPEKEYV